jgi:hypothetical protein
LSASWKAAGAASPWTQLATSFSFPKGINGQSETT